MISFCI